MSFCADRVKCFVKVRLHCIVNNLKRISEMSTLPLPSPGKISADTHGKGTWDHSNESLPIATVRNTAERSFSKLTLIKAFHRSSMADESLTNLAMMSIESETAKKLDMNELTKTFAVLKTWKK